MSNVLAGAFMLAICYDVGLLLFTKITNHKLQASIFSGISFLIILLLSTVSIVSF